MFLSSIVNKLADREIRERNQRFSSMEKQFLLDEDDDIFSNMTLPDIESTCIDRRFKTKTRSTTSSFDPDELDELTERLTHQEEQIYLEKERWEATFNAIPDIVLIIDKDKKIINVNDCFVTSTNCSKDEVIGKFCYDVLGIDKICSNCKGKSLGKCGQRTVDIVHVAEGTYFKGSYSFLFNPIIDKNDQYVANVVVLRDITKLTTTEKVLASRERLLNIINFAGSILIQDVGWDDSVNMVLENIQNNFGVDVSFILRKEETPGRYVIINSSSTKPFNMAACNEKLKSQNVLEYMNTYMTDHKIYTPLIYRSDFLGKDDYPLLENLGFSSILTVPIIINNEEWGMVGIGNFGDKLSPEFVWDQMKIRVLSTVSNLLSAFITKIRMRDAIGHIPDEEKWTHFITAILNDQLEYSIRFNHELCLTFVSKAFCSMVEKTKDQLLGSKLQTILPNNSKYLQEVFDTIKTFTKDKPFIERLVKLDVNGISSTHKHVIRAIYNGSDVPIDFQCVGINLDAVCKIRGGV
jgi:PAS domain-containing protein